MVLVINAGSVIINVKLVSQLVGEGPTNEISSNPKSLLPAAVF